MQRENLADCQPGDWVAMIDAEELQPDEGSNLKAWGDWFFRLTELPIKSGTLFGWVRE